MPELSESWKCLRCGWAVDLPIEEAEPELFHELIGQIRRHRLKHITEEGTARKLEGLLNASAEEVWEACGDKDVYINAGSTGDTPIETVTQEDVAPILEGIDKLLRDDFPAAQRRAKWLTP